MSFIACLFKKDIIYVSADGRVTDNKTLEIKEEDAKKYKKISPKQYMLFTGNRGASVDIMERYPEINTLYDLGQLSNQLLSLITTVDPKDAYINITLCGLNIDGELHVISMDNVTKNIEDRNLKNCNGFNFISMGSDVNPFNDYKRAEMLGGLLKGVDTSKNYKVRRVLVELNNKMAEVDRTVNDNVTTFIISKN